MKRYGIYVDTEIDASLMREEKNGDYVLHSDALAALESLRERAAAKCEVVKHGCHAEMACHQLDANNIRTLPLIEESPPTGDNRKEELDKKVIALQQHAGELGRLTCDMAEELSQGWRSVFHGTTAIICQVCKREAETKSKIQHTAECIVGRAGSFLKSQPSSREGV